MNNDHRINPGKKCKCVGSIFIEKGILSVDCSDCKGKMDLSRPECFIGVSERMIPGFQGAIVLKGEQHRHYEGSIVETITAHSHILKDINSLPDGRPTRRLRVLSSRMEREFKKDPMKLIDGKEQYLSEIRKAVREKKPKEAERFKNIVESISKMVRRLDRDIKRKE